MVLYVQVVGNLIYYRYMNPAIVAPDAFDIVSLGVDKGLTPDQVQHTQLNIVNLIINKIPRNQPSPQIFG